MMCPHGAGTRARALASILAVAVGAMGSAPADDPATEWTLEDARRCWQPMIRPVQHVGVPGYDFQAGVLWDGSLVFGPLEPRDLPVLQRESAPLGENRLHISFAYGERPELIDRRGAESTRLRRRLELGRLPIPRISVEDGGVLWEELVFADLLGRRVEEGMEPRRDDVLVVHALFTARNPGPSAREGHLWIHLGDTSGVRFGYKCFQEEALSPPVAHRLDPPLGLVGEQVRYVLPSLEKGRIVFHDRVPEVRIAGSAGATTEGKSVLEWIVPLAPGEEARLRLLVPYGLVDPPTGAAVAALDSDRALESVRSFWRGIERGPGRIVTPDPFVNDYLAAVAGQMCQQVSYRHESGIWLYKTSPNHYESYWPCNAAKALPALDLRGLSRISEPVLRGFLDSQTDDVRGMEKGAMGRDQKLPGEGFARVHGFLGNFGEWTANPLLLSHGMGMWALAAHYRITRDDAWLRGGPRPPLDALLAAFDWIRDQRRRTMREVGGQKVDHWGLLPAASAHDWLAGSTIFNDAFCMYGMAEVVRLLREIGHPRAEEMARELAEYRGALRDRYGAARDRARPLPLVDGTLVPYVPRMVSELDWARLDWTYTGYGPLRAGAWGALDPDDELVSQSLAFLEAGMPRGVGPYFSAHAEALAEARGRRPAADVNWADVSDPGAASHHIWRHYVEYETMWPVGGPLFLERDDLPRFFEWLFHNLAAAVHSEWRVGVESLDGVPSCAPGDGERWQCIRKMFVNERGGAGGEAQALWLLQALPRSWLRPGSRLLVRDMGTLFGGRVDLTVDVEPGGDSVSVDVSWRDLATAPSRVVMRLRSGDGSPLRAAEVDGRKVEILGGDRIELPWKPSARFRVTAAFR